MQAVNPPSVKADAGASHPGAVASCEGLTRDYGNGRTVVHALRGISAAFRPGTLTAVMGPSGSGKTTLLHCLAGMDRPTAGRIWWGTTEVSRLREARLAELRRSRVGFVFQSFNLMPAMTVTQNVMLPGVLAGHPADGQTVLRALAEVGLTEYARKRPGQLSGGQQQRVAVARALVSRPGVLFADEPTGSLDRATGREVLALLRDNVDRHGQTCVMVTHDPLAAGYADRVLLLVDGLLVDDLDHPSPATIARRLEA